MMNQARCELVAQVLPVFLLVIAVRGGRLNQQLKRKYQMPSYADAGTRFWVARVGTPRNYAAVFTVWSVLAEVLLVIGAGRPEGLTGTGSAELWWDIAGNFAVAGALMVLLFAVVEMVHQTTPTEE
jgi:hypothetical protein